MKIIGLDTGTVTGLCVWNVETQQIEMLASMTIHRALRLVSEIRPVLVRIEDARLRKNFGESGPEKWQGAGSIKRDAKIWEDFLKDEKIPFEMVAPAKNKTKVSHDQFCKETGWQAATNEHSRDGAMLVVGLTKGNVRLAVAKAGKV